MSSFRGNSSSNHGNNHSGDDDEGWGSKFFKAASVAGAAAAVAGGLYAVLTSSSSTPNSEVQHSPYESRAIRWTKPESGWVKLNVDGSRDHISHPRSSGCGGVLRNSSGKWLRGFSQKLDPSVEVHETELEAILKGLELAWNMNIEKLVLESDSDSALSMVEKGVKDNHRQSDVISRIRKLRDDPKWEVKIVVPAINTKANKVANKLANEARGLLIGYLHPYYDPPASCAAFVKEDAA